MKRGNQDLAHKHQTLVQEYLELQKEFVSKKKKLESIMHSRDILWAEVRFLRQRHKYLLKTRYSKQGLGSDGIQPQNLDLELRQERNPSPYGAEFRNQHSVLVSNSDLMSKLDGESEAKQQGLRREEIVRKMLKAKKPSTSYFIDDKSEGKKKMSWQDPETLRV